MKYKATIGLEIHTELKTNSKMFCSCKNDPFHSKQNENICPVCLGMPGTLPVLNKQAIEWTIKTGLALNCKIGHPFPSGHSERSEESRYPSVSPQDDILYTKWDRKNYFYPDLPKAYQISQYDLPLCGEGYLEINPKSEARNPKQIQNSNNQNSKRKIRITRIHLEEDTGTLKHPEGRENVDYSLADYNRSGVPLMELVTEPDIETAQEAKEFCKEYQLILRHLKISDADMEKGQMRCEANISIRKLSTINNQLSTKLGTKVEVKNLNSFKAVEKAIEYEIERQTEALESGDKIIQETRGWDDAKGKTYVMRIKETSADYRYFPEPDLPPVTLSKSYVEKLKSELPESRKEKIKRWISDYDLDQKSASLIAGDSMWTSEFEERVPHTRYPKDLGTWIVNEPDFLDIPTVSSGTLVNYVHEGELSRSAAKGIFLDLKQGKSPRDIIEEKGLKQISDGGELESIVDKILKENPDVVANIKAGKTQAIGFLVGLIMRETKGQANPQIVNEIINKKIK